MIRLALVVGLAGCADDGGPRLEMVDPAAAARDSVVVLTGRRLCGPHGDCATAAGEVLIGIAQPNAQAIVMSYADTSAEIVVPAVAPTGKTQIAVTVDGRTSNALAFEVVP